MTTNRQNIETLCGHPIDPAFTRPRRTDTPDVRAAIDRGDFADARWLRCEFQLDLIADGPTATARDVRRCIIATSNAMMDMGDHMSQARPAGAKVH